MSLIYEHIILSKFLLLDRRKKKVKHFKILKTSMSYNIKNFSAFSYPLAIFRGTVVTLMIHTSCISEGETNK